jgi:hypothetical protein
VLLLLLPAMSPLATCRPGVRGRQAQRARCGADPAICSQLNCLLLLLLLLLPIAM